MAGAFSAEDQHHFVSNKRFCALMEWAIEVASEINEAQAADFVAKMQQGYDELYAICTDIDLDKELDKKEQVFWSKAFQIVGHRLFNRTLGSTESDDWRPSAIADAFTISRMLQKLSGEYLVYTKQNF
ncbi:hypothetical protein [Ectopseudomonas alcaliphila]|uniref:Uncharacterized protein n=1 Tax=Ectopseudomonas alcaliphila TaxID=101564 RepID=A0ABU4Q3U5_9GAMM|nr:hypothetical protein [Pseudomonas alcaliphila]MDX5993940.1 hypothetical protein [Pseudomonas alcaliphila]